MIIVHTTKQQIIDLMEVQPFKYDEQTGGQYRIIPAWMYMLLYMSTPVSSDDVDAADLIMQV